MKTNKLFTGALSLLMAVSLITVAGAQTSKMKMTSKIPAAYTAPDMVETSIGTLRYFDGVPSKVTTEAVYDYLDRSRAVNVFLNSIPTLSMNALREGQAAMGCVKANEICIWDSLMDSKSILLTGMKLLFWIYIGRKWS